MNAPLITFEIGVDGRELLWTTRAPARSLVDPAAGHFSARDKHASTTLSAASPCRRLSISIEPASRAVQRSCPIFGGCRPGPGAGVPPSRAVGPPTRAGTNFTRAHARERRRYSGRPTLDRPTRERPRQAPAARLSEGSAESVPRNRPVPQVRQHQTRLATVLY